MHAAGICCVIVALKLLLLLQNSVRKGLCSLQGTDVMLALAKRPVWLPLLLA
jgi:hypothetical protein